MTRSTAPQFQSTCPKTPRAGLWLVAIGLLVVAPLEGQQLTQGEQGKLTTWFRNARRSAPGAWGIAIADQSGNVLWGIEPEVPLVPASAVKILTTGFARSEVGGTAHADPPGSWDEASVDSTNGTWLGSWASGTEW